MKKFILLALLIPVLGITSDLSLVWDANSEENVIGYRIYQDGIKLADTAVNSFLLPDTIRGIHSFTVTAYNASKESNPSEPLTYNFDPIKIVYKDAKIGFYLRENNTAKVFINGIEYAVIFGAVSDTVIVKLPNLESSATVTVQTDNVNQASISVPMSGDVDGDGLFTAADEREFDKSFGYWEKYIGYRLEFDFNRDGKINVDDQIIFDSRKVPEDVK